MSKKIIKNNIKKNESVNSSEFFTVRGSPPSSSFCEQSLLYRFVYKSRISFSVVFLLLISFTIQSVHKVYADEVVSGIDVTELVVSDDNYQPDISDVITTENQDLTETTEVTADVVDENEILSTDTEISVEDSVGVSDETISQEIIETANTNETEIEELITDASSTTPEVNNTDIVLESDENSSSTNTGVNNEDLVSESDIVEETVENEVVEDEIVEPPTPMVSVTNSDSVFTFDKNQCTKLASGSFYCLELDKNLMQDALFAAPDADGDLEIFLVRGGVQSQITKNKMDDAAPYFDMNSNTIVWHRLVDDRYQIISYDIDSEVQTQLTSTAENNMEPTRQGKYTVWQRWVDGGWNIILSDGHNESQITHTSSSNIAPYVHGTLVVWNTFNKNGEKEIQMYDIKTGTYVTVDDPDGMSVSNPRMVFVYDSLHPNGDVVTKGYDILAKKFINLDTMPKELPDQLPESESTGETRALIQSKPTIKSEGAESVDIDVSNGTSTDNGTTTIEVPVDLVNETLTLDLSQISTTTPISDEEMVPEEPLLSSDFDIVIEPLVQSEASTTETVQE